MFRELIDSYKKSVSKTGSQPTMISASEVRLIKIIEYLFSEIQNSKGLSSANLKDHENICEIRDQALEHMIKEQSKIIEAQNKRIDTQTEVLKHIAESFKFLWSEDSPEEEKS